MKHLAPTPIPPLFAPIARTTDPATSHKAAARITRSGSRERRMDVFVRLVRETPGLTAAELSARHKESQYEASKRLSDAFRAGLINRGVPRACSVTGHDAFTWVPPLVVT